MPELLDDRGQDYDEYLLYRPNPLRPDVWSIQLNAYRWYLDVPTTHYYDGTLVEVMHLLKLWQRPRPEYPTHETVETRYRLMRQAWED